MNHLRTGWLLVWLGLAGTSYGAGSNDLPELGDASSSLISPQMEREIGEDFLKQIHAALPTIDDPVLKYYVDQQLADLAQHSDLKERVLSTVLIDSDQINAFAAPGGIVGINLGLMLYADDVHEYSSVIAHELAHLSQRHFARGIEEQRSQSLTSIAAMIAAIMIGAIGGGDAGIAAMSTVQAIAQSKQLSYSRGREQEADRVGLNTLVRADLDPQGMARMFERMQRAYRYSRKPPEFMLTHPLSETRIADAKSHARQYGNVPRETSVEYQMMRARAMVHYATAPLAAVKEFEKRVRDNPEDLSARYGLALALSANEQHDQAIALNDQLYSSNSHNILYAASYADVLTTAGKTDQAIKLLERVLKLNPDNPPLSMLYADALVADEQYEAAEAVLKRQSFVNKRDVDVWYNLAEVSGLAGNIVGVHLARAEYFTLHGAYQRAIQHLEYARRLTSRNNEQLHARLDQRITDLRDMLRERRS